MNSKTEISMKRKYTRDEISYALTSCLDNGCDSCALQKEEDCITVRNYLASEYIRNPIVINEKPLTLYEIIEILQKRKFIYAEGYGCIFISEIIINDSKISIFDNNHNCYFYDNNTKFYSIEV